MTAFEARLTGLFSEYAEQAPVEFDTTDVLEAIRTAKSSRLRAFPQVARRRWLASVVLAALLLAALAATVLIGALLLTRNLPRIKPLVIQPTGFMTQQRAGAAAATMADGRVLVVGGRNGYAGANQFFAEVYDPVTRTFTPTGSLSPVNATGATATVLRDGRVLYAGGLADQHAVLATAVLYDPVTKTFLALPDMTTPRTGHSATLLADGRVALIGGANGLTTDSPVAIEYFDPNSLSFTAGPDPDQLRRASTVAESIGGGRVLVYIRGRPPGPSEGIGDSGFVLDTTTGQVAQAALSPPGLASDLTVSGATQLLDGRIALIVAGPSAARAGGNLVIVFDPQAGTYADPADLGGLVVIGPATLSDGRVLVGEHSVGNCADVFAEVFDPRDMTVKRIGQIGGIGGCVPAPGATVAALEDGSALIVGGLMSSGQETSSASLVHP